MYYNTPDWSDLCIKDPYYAWKDIEMRQANKIFLTRDDWFFSNHVYIDLQTQREIDDDNYWEKYLSEQYQPEDYEPVPDWKVTSDRITQLLTTS